MAYEAMFATAHPRLPEAGITPRLLEVSPFHVEFLHAATPLRPSGRSLRARWPRLTAVPLREARAPSRSSSLSRSAVRKEAATGDTPCPLVPSANPAP
jgi:hypothetical protein